MKLGSVAANMKISWDHAAVSGNTVSRSEAKRILEKGESYVTYNAGAAFGTGKFSLAADAADFVRGVKLALAQHHFSASAFEEVKKAIGPSLDGRQGDLADLVASIRKDARAGHVLVPDDG